MLKRLLRWLYWRYAAKDDPKLEALPSTIGAVQLAVGPRFRIKSSATGEVLFESDDSRATKQEFYRYTGVELWDGSRCRGRR